MSWVPWIQSEWPTLASGKKVSAPLSLPHPGFSGFHRIEIATPAGQVADWVMTLSDKSRIHVHEFADGRLVAHRDQYDPDVSVGNLVNHLLGETFVGPLVAIVVGVAIIKGLSDG